MPKVPTRLKLQLDPQGTHSISKLFYPYRSLLVFCQATSPGAVRCLICPKNIKGDCVEVEYRHIKRHEGTTIHRNALRRTSLPSLSSTPPAPDMFWDDETAYTVRGFSGAVDEEDLGSSSDSACAEPPWCLGLRLVPAFGSPPQRSLSPSPLALSLALAPAPTPPPPLKRSHDSSGCVSRSGSGSAAYV